MNIRQRRCEACRVPGTGVVGQRAHGWRTLGIPLPAPQLHEGGGLHRIARGRGLRTAVMAGNRLRPGRVVDAGLQDPVGATGGVDHRSGGVHGLGGEEHSPDHVVEPGHAVVELLVSLVQRAPPDERRARVVAFHGFEPLGGEVGGSAGCRPRSRRPRNPSHRTRPRPGSRAGRRGGGSVPRRPSGAAGLR